MNFKVATQFQFLLMVALTGLLTSNAWSQETETQETETKVKKIVDAKLGATKNVHRAGDLWFAGQFTPADIGELKKQGFKRVITLRTDGEIDWDEKKMVEQAGMEFISIPFRKPETLNDEVFNLVRKQLKGDHKTLFHCGSANRVGGVWLPFRVLDEKVELEQAIKEAEMIGLRTPFIKEKALEYIKRQK